MTSTLSTTAGTAILTQIITGGIQNPFPLYDELRELEDGVHWCAELNGWVVTRAADIRRTGEDAATYSSDMADASGANNYDRTDPRQVRYGEIGAKFLFFLDPPEHTQVRRVFRHAFTPKAVSKYGMIVERVADDLLAEFSSGDEVDFMEKLAAKIPIETIATILGVPPSDFPIFAEWTDALMFATDPSVQGPARVKAVYKSAELVDYMSAIADDRRKSPKDDLISVIVNTEVEDGKPLDPKLALSQAVILLVAGNDTTTNLIGNGITILMDRPEVMRRLQGDPSLIPQAVEEMLRYDPPFHFDFRKIAKDHQIGEHELRAGLPIFHCIAAGNRDPREFPDPLTFDIDRENKRHMSFSSGIHRCVGAPLARMEALVAFTKILERFPNITHGSAPAKRKVTNVVARGWETRPVTLLS